MSKKFLHTLLALAPSLSPAAESDAFDYVRLSKPASLDDCLSSAFRE